MSPAAAAGRRIELTGEALASFDFGRLRAYSLAQDGACGEPGGVKLLTEDGQLYHFNRHDVGVRWEEVRPQMDAALENRACEYLGLGNVLFFRDGDAGWLLERRDRAVAAAESPADANPFIVLYRHWVAFFRERIEEEAHKQ